MYVTVHVADGAIVPVLGLDKWEDVVDVSTTPQSRLGWVDVTGIMENPWSQYIPLMRVIGRPPALVAELLADTLVGVMVRAYGSTEVRYANCNRNDVERVWADVL
jgi:hypothetical protein